jgi:hypothetical protein
VAAADDWRASIGIIGFLRPLLASPNSMIAAAIALGHQ